MAQLGVNYDPRNYEPQKAFEPLPRGDYPVIVVNTAVKQTKAGDGSMLEVELDVQSGQYANRKLFDRITLENKNDKAVQIGQSQLSGLCHAVGYLQPLVDSDVLHGRTCVVRVGIEKGDGQYQDKNKVSAYMSADAAKRQPAEQAAPAQKPAAATGGGKSAPWRK